MRTIGGTVFGDFVMKRVRAGGGVWLLIVGVREARSVRVIGDARFRTSAACHEAQAMVTAAVVE